MKFDYTHTTTSNLFDLIIVICEAPIVRKLIVSHLTFSLMLIFLGVFGFIYYLIKPRFVLILSNFSHYLRINLIKPFKYICTDNGTDS